MFKKIDNRNLTILATISLFLNAIFIQALVIVILRLNHVQPSLDASIIPFTVLLTCYFGYFGVRAFLSIPPKATNSKTSVP
jgi:hypothetical protein